MEGGSGGSFSLDSHFISQSGVNLIDTSIRVTNTSNADLAFGGGANSEGATLYYLPSGHIPSTSTSSAGREESGDTAIQSFAERNAIIRSYEVGSV